MALTPRTYKAVSDMDAEDLRKEVRILRKENDELLSDNIKLAHMVAHRTARLALFRKALRIPGSYWFFLKGWI